MPLSRLLRRTAVACLAFNARGQEESSSAGEESYKDRTNGYVQKCKSSRICTTLAGASAGLGAIAAAPVVIGAAAGIGAAGPVAGGAFAAAQAAAGAGVAGGGGVAAGGALAATQGFVMSGASWAAVTAGTAVGGVVGSWSADDCEKGDDRDPEQPKPEPEPEPEL